jgi:restriction system protein
LDLTEAGRYSHLDHNSALRIYHDIHKTFKEDGTQAAAVPSEPEEAGAPPDEQTPGEEAFREEMARTLHSLSPEGFERLCQRILREVGFEEVVVTGRSGDGGIDGFGILRINRLVSDRVLFQCKRHTKQISPSYVREFRGSMAARADRGIFLATSTFSADAKREAAREGAAPIEMVDLAALISLLSDFGLGVTTRTIFTVDWSFFREYGASGSDRSSNHSDGERRQRLESKVSTSSQRRGSPA